ncbi:DUF4132 domain-containing protein [Virgisporangium aurantiacum]|uniref:DUF4132 domain-containing protein n=1 Tax=Virgisporangium aurantiacum TaxID=175570 RepID=A0A8J4E453_9ACTN|nr:DUF4132 domain-containing protein [Virgisporangium aurantiacum]GIJ60714.1 hypothetical protein Vau01_082300 [Virgisporangium aurantiacum]
MPNAPRFEAVRRLAKARDVPGLAAELVTIAGTNHGDWSYDYRHVFNTLEAEVRSGLALAIIERAAELTDPNHRVSAHQLVAAVGERLGTATPPQVAEAMLRSAGRFSTYWPPAQLLVYAKVLEHAGRPLTPEAVAVVRRTAHGDRYDNGDLKKYARTLTDPPLNCGEAWADAVNAAVGGGGPWAELVAHAATATGPRPTETWAKKAVELLADLPGDEAGATLRGWLGLVGRPRTLPLERNPYEYDVNEAFDLHNATPLRGLIWLTVHVPEHPDTARLLGALVDTALRKVAGLGPRSPKTANAAVQALSGLGTEAALAQLARLTTRVTFKGTVKELDAALEAVARSLNLSRDEVEELAVPTYGLTGVGRRVVEFGPEGSAVATAVVEVSGGRAVVTWSNAGGRAVKAPPAAVRTDHAEELKELKASVKDLDQMLSAQADRLDRQFLAQRVWTFDTWRERYLDHPLLGTLARRLIWLVDDRPVAFADGRLRDVNDEQVDEGDEVRLWHPIGRPVVEVVAWRTWLERHGITQPFKQAHREVYLLTAAEERTATYSNRFAAHVLRQHQFHALAAVRGWRNKLRLMVDDVYPPPKRELPGWGLRAEFWVEGIGEDYGGDDTTESGTYFRIATDQVRFYSVGAAENEAHAGGGGYGQHWHTRNPVGDPVPLVDIPPLVFSEVMRDVDLFVGVASVGNDPTWQDGGPRGRHREYWAEYAFGELGATAQTRRELLERLVPRLAIADRATVSGRFLEVRGTMRTYRIHLGSGNILMSPNDQYLCIVPKQTPDRAGPVFLPFDGDRVLALILSKALLLARDDSITDETILQQIRS